MFSSITNNQKFNVLAACGLACLLAIVVQAQYNAYDSDSNSELGKLVRKSQSASQRYNYNPSQDPTRNVYNRQQPMQLAPSYNQKRSSSGEAGLSGYGMGSPFMGASASNGRGRNSEVSSNNDDDDDRESANFGPQFNAPSFDGESSNAGPSSNADDDGEGGQPMNLNQAASGYPNQGDYNNDAGFGAGFGFGGPSSGGFGAANDDGEGSSLGPSSDSYEGDGRRAKSASSPSGSRNFGNLDDEASSGGGATKYGPNSAVNSERDPDDEGSAAYPAGGSQADEGDDD